jgi:8-oxo-dGTP pyrophosphatase MutT (NUDIX family)
MVPDNVCPVILRGLGRDRQILAFEHPLAGRQLVKGSITPGELADAAAVRELGDESGILHASVVRELGTWESDYAAQVWALVECRSPQRLQETWIHRAPDDGGHSFRFFWQPLFAQPSADQWHRVFCDALEFIRIAAQT